MIKMLLYLPFIVFATDELDVAKISEAMGHMIGKNLEALGLDFDLEAVVKGIKDESEGKNSPMNEDECVQAIAAMQEEKMTNVIEEELECADAVSNGDQILNLSE